jgi:hypothetical protein
MRVAHRPLLLLLLLLLLLPPATATATATATCHCHLLLPLPPYLSCLQLDNGVGSRILAAPWSRLEQCYNTLRCISSHLQPEQQQTARVCCVRPNTPADSIKPNRHSKPLDPACVSVAVLVCSGDRILATAQWHSGRQPVRHIGFVSSDGSGRYHLPIERCIHGASLQYCTAEHSPGSGNYHGCNIGVPVRFIRPALAVERPNGARLDHQSRPSVHRLDCRIDLGSVPDGGDGVVVCVDSKATLLHC